MAYYMRKKLILPEAHGVKELEIGSNSVYLRWAFLSTHSLSLEQMNALIFELQTSMTTSSASTTTICTFHNSQQDIQREFKVRLNGLHSNTKYRFTVRCKLTYNHRMIYSDWSNRIEFNTKPLIITAITNQSQLDIASLKHQVTEYHIKCKELEAENQELVMKMNAYVPPHQSWDPKQIVEWIMRIENGIFKEYKENLLMNLAKEEIDGASLFMLDMNDLQRLGITKFAHKKILLTHIHRLTEHDDVPEFQYDHNSAQTIQKTRLAQQKRLARVPRSDSKTDDLSETPRMSFPKQNTHFAMPQATLSDENSIGNMVSTPPESTSNGDKKEVETLPELTANEESESTSLGLISQSVKNLLLSSPENEPLKKWKYKNGVLMVKIIKATDVDNMDQDDGPDSASDPYVELELKGHYRKERTQVINNNANPVWNERFQLFPENPKKDVLKLKLWDKDFWTFDDEIGSVFIAVIDVLNANGYVEKAYDIVGSTCGAKLYLELKYKELQH